ncbi:uncharacterized protein LOC136085586 [Hydra vulgaris]|uniref:Uncharacterized protein LOC136085586 n=1 Tax=Hydra vulgaris TaxID=6087 RepID=A0ABM4CMC6_HYDVU
MEVYFIFVLHVIFSLKICELHLERCSLNLKFETNNFLTRDWLLWGQLYSYCMHSNVEKYHSSQISSDERCVTTNCNECMSCFLKFCINSTTAKTSESCKFGCQLYSSIADHINKNFGINEQDKPYIKSTSKIVSTKCEYLNITFMWENVFSKNNMIPSVYLVTITSIDEDNSTECVIDLVSENILNVSNQLVCGMSNIPIQDIGTKFQLNVYPVNYNGYNELSKLTYNSLNDYILNSKEFTIIHGSLVGTLKVLKKVYTVSFNVKPINYTKGLKSVLHITLGNNNEVYGDRNPGIWFHEDGSGKLVIFAAVNGSTTFYIETPPLRLGVWSYITICQSYLESKYWFSVFLNGINIIRTENSDARDFKNMKVYASDCWYDAQDGYITDLLVINGHAEQIVGNTKTALEKEKIIAEIPKLNEEYLISFDFYPNNFFSDWRNIVHFTIGSNYENYGDRTPGIWFEPGSSNKKIHISAPINGNSNYIFSTLILNLILKNQWSNIKVAQILLNKLYIFTIIINGTVVVEKVNYKCQSFDNVKVYASDPWYEAQDGFIKNFFVINGISNSSMQPIVVLPSDYILHSKEFTIIHGSLVGTLKVLKKVYTVFFNVKPTNYTRGLKSVLHITLGDNNEVYGDRNPGVWFHEDGSGKLVIFAAVNGSTTFYIETPPLRLGVWSYITICQSYLESKYWFSVFLNGINIIRTENSDARDFKNMKVYASDCWYDAQDGYITDLLVINGHAEQLVGNEKTRLEKGKIIAEIPKLNEEYLISFDFYPNNFFSDWRNIVHFTIGSDYENYGDRTPGIWFEPGSSNKKIHISAPINDNSNYIFSTLILNLILKNQWSNIKVAQILLNKLYIFTIIINGTVVVEKVNYKYQSFDNVKVYASDPWYEAQYGFIKNFFVINGISNSSTKPIVVLPSDYIILKTEFTLMKGLYVGFLNVMKMEYTISFSIKPKIFTKGLINVLHFTLTKSFRDYGYRNPSVWFHQDGSGKLVIFPVNNNNSNYSIETVPLKLGEWSSVKIYQSLINNEYWLSVDLNGVNIHRMKNDKAVELKRIKVYASDPWHDALNGSISNIQIVNGKIDFIIDNVPAKLLKGKIIAEIPRLSLEYIISFDLNSKKCFFNSCSVVNFISDFDNSNYEEKTPGVWFNYNRVFTFTLPNSGCHRDVFNTDPIELDLWQNIEISQIKKLNSKLKNSEYMYTIKVNEEVVYSDVNYEPKYFKNIKVYASDPLYKTHDGIIKNFFVVNGISNKHKFSLTFDEYIAVKIRRYINFNLHHNEGLQWLGMLRIQGTMPATKAIKLISDKYNSFDLKLDKDIVASVTNGASLI